jgi:hypothetical protein
MVGGDHRLHASQTLQPNGSTFCSQPLRFPYFFARNHLSSGLLRLLLVASSPSRRRSLAASKPRPSIHGARRRRRGGEADGQDRVPPPPAHLPGTSPSAPWSLPSVSSQIWGTTAPLGFACFAVPYWNAPRRRSACTLTRVS